MGEGSLHNREELLTPCPGVTSGEGGLHTGTSADWPAGFDLPRHVCQDNVTAQLIFVASKVQSPLCWATISTLAQGRREGPCSC